MTFGLCYSQPACRPHPASLPVRVPTVESLLSASFSFTSRLRLAVSLRLPSSAPVGSFHPTSSAHAGHTGAGPWPAAGSQAASPSRVSLQERPGVLDRFAQLVRLPPEVKPDRALALDTCSL